MGHAVTLRFGPAQLIRLVAAVAIVLAGVGLGVSVPPAAAGPATVYGTWGAQGPGTVNLIDSGSSDGLPSFSYSYDNPSDSGAPLQTWTFATTAGDDVSSTESVPYTYKGLHAWFEVTVFLTAFIDHDGSVTTTKIVDDGPESCCTAPSNGFSYTGTYDFTGLQPGDTFGFYLGGSNGDYNSILNGTLSLGGQSPTFTSSQPADGSSWPTATALGSGNTSTTGTILAPGDEDWYKLPIEPDSQLQVTLSNLPADYDLAVFSDIDQTFNSDLAAINNGGDGNLTELSAEQPGNVSSPSAFSPSAFSPSAFSPSAFSPSAFSPSAFSPSAFSPSAFSPSAFSPSAFSPSAFSPSAFSPSAFSPSAFSPSAFSASYADAQVRSLLGVSSQTGTANKTVSVDTWNNTGDFYIRVSSHNGAAASQSPFTLTVSTNGGPCDGLQLNTYSSDPTLSGTPGSAQTVILTDSSRMSIPGSLGTDLQTLAGKTNGVVVDVHQSTKVADLQAQADAHKACPYAENLVAQAIRDIVNSYRDPQGTLKYVVIVGDDDVIPFFRYPDTAGLAPESGYVPPVSSTSFAAGALDSDDYLSDDAYGAATDLSYKGTQLPIPDVAVGRLVETPSEIDGQVQQFLTDNGELGAPTSSLVTGYDFMQPAADQVENAFEAGMANGTTHDQLITNQGVSPSDTTTDSGPDRDHSWTASDLKSALFGSHHDLVFLGGHFSANNTLAADYSSTVVTTDLAAAVDKDPSLLQNTLVLGAGCHGGYNLENGDGVPGVTLGLDWPEAFAQSGATLISGTGYQYGDTDFLAYSDKLYVDIAKELRSGAFSGAVPIGDALVDAEQDYLGGVTQLTGIDQKALLETTLYGLPMLGIDMPNRSPAPGSGSSSVSASPVNGDPGQTLGLEEADLSVDPSLTTHTQPVVNMDGSPSSASYTWLSGSDGTVSNPGEPTLPLQSEDVTVPNEVLRGVGFRGGTYSDTPGTTPLTGAPATELGSVHTTFDSPVFFPQTLWNPNYFDALSGGDTKLLLTPAQNRSDGATTDTLRQYSHLDLDLFYSNNTKTYGNNVPALAAPPTISQVGSAVESDGQTVDISADVAGDPSAGIQQVWATYTDTTKGDPDYGTWKSVDLTQSSSNSTTWQAKLPASSTPQDVRFMLQAVNGSGLVSMDNNDGYLFTPGVIPGAAASNVSPTTLTLASANPNGGHYGDAVFVAATLDGSSINLAGRTVTFGLGPITLNATTDNSGTARAQIPLGLTPGTYDLTASYAGDSDADGSSTDSPGFTVSQAATSLEVSGPTQSVVTGSDPGVTATLTSGGLPMRSEPVYFDVADPHGTLVSTVLRTTDVNGQAQLGAMQLPPGADTVTAFFGASGLPIMGGTVDATDADFAASTDTTTVHVTAPTTTVLSASPPSPTYGQSVQLAATVTPSDGGTVAFLADGNPIGGCGAQSLSSQGGVQTATCTIDSLPAGVHNFEADYAGDTAYLASKGTTSTTLSQAASAVTLSAPDSTTYGSTVNLSAAVPAVPGGSAPTGTVTFYDAGAVVGTVSLPGSASNTAALSLPNLAAGTHHFQAMYSGDGNYAGSTDAATTTVSQAATTTSLSATASPVFGQPVVLTAAVSPTDSGGTVGFTVDGQTPGGCGAVPVQVSGAQATATCTVNGLSVGAHDSVAAYSGDANLIGSHGSTSLTVGRSATTTTLSAPGTSQFGSPVALSAVVAPVAPGTGQPTGNVTFYDGSGIIGAAALVVDKTGVDSASLTVGGFLGGVRSLKAVYGGDSDFATSQGVTAETVGFTTTISADSSGPMTVKSGQAILVSANVHGPITVQKGGALEVTGSVSGPISSSGAAQLALCGAEVHGPVSIGSTSGWVFIGGDTCPASSVSGPISLTNNKGGLELSGATISGPVSVTGNSELGPIEVGGSFPPPTISGNTIHGPLACRSNSPAPTDNSMPNTASTRSGQCAGNF